MRCSPGVTFAGMNREGDGVILAIARHGEQRGPGVDRQPAGRLQPERPLRGTFHVAVHGAREIESLRSDGHRAGRGRDRHRDSRPHDQRIRGTMPKVERSASPAPLPRDAAPTPVGQLHAGRKRIRRKREVPIARIDQIVIGLLFVGPREIRPRERGVGGHGDIHNHAILCMRGERLRRIGGRADLPRFAIGRLHFDGIDATTSGL